MKKDPIPNIVSNMDNLPEPQSKMWIYLVIIAVVAVIAFCIYKRNAEPKTEG